MMMALVADLVILRPTITVLLRRMGHGIPKQQQAPATTDPQRV